MAGKCYWNCLLYHNNLDAKGQRSNEAETDWVVWQTHHFLPLWVKYGWFSSFGLLAVAVVRDHAVRDRPSMVSRYTQSRWIWVVCMTARLDVMLKTTEQNWIVCTSKSEAEVTNNKKTARGIVLLKLTTDRANCSELALHGGIVRWPTWLPNVFSAMTLLVGSCDL